MINPIAAINYNGSKDTVELVDSLCNSGEEFDLIVVDNLSSQENELKTISEYISAKYAVNPIQLDYTNERIVSGCRIEISDSRIVTLLQGKENYGFAIGTNIGLEYGLFAYPEAEYLTILNNDTIVTPGFLSKVISAIEKNNLAAAMGTILYYGYDKPYIWSIGGPIDFFKGQGIHVEKDSIFIPEKYSNEFIERQFISGCFTVFSRKSLVEIGLLDEDYFFAGEEYQYSIDLTKRHTIGWIPDSIIYHKSVMGIGNGSSHKISDIKWQYNAYMVKIVFVNKNKGTIFRWFWHILLRLYVLSKLKRKYLSIAEYGEKNYKLLRSELFSNINATRFLRQDFERFANLLIDESNMTEDM